MRNLKLGNVRFVVAKDGSTGAIGQFALDIPTAAVLDHFINGYFTDPNHGLLLVPPGNEAVRAAWSPEELANIQLTDEQLWAVFNFLKS